MSQLPDGSLQSYTSTSATVGGRREHIADARRKQQEQQTQKAAEHAIKLKEKEAEKREKKIKQWESMHGRGAGHLLGGSGNIFCTSQAEREQIKHEEVTNVRWRMQSEHNIQVNHALQMGPIQSSPDIDQNAEKLRQREEAKRQQKIAAWEKMNGNVSGNVLGGNRAVAVQKSPNLRDQGPVKGYFQAAGESAFTSQASVYAGTSFLRNQTTSATANIANQFQQGENKEEISEKVKKERMQAARLRMQQMMDQKVANQKH